MEQPNKETLEKFNEVLKKLSHEDRAKLYEHLKVLSPEDRNAAIIKLVERSNASTKVKETPITPVARDVATHELENSRMPSREPSKKVAKKRLKKSVKNAIVAFVAVLVLVVAALFALPKLLPMLKTNNDVIESTSVSETTETEVAATSEVEETTPTPIPEPTATPAPTPVPLVPGAPDLTGMTIVLDPGHQEVTDDETESCATWLSVSKPRCTSGATGVITGTHEYDLTLEYCLVIKSYLEQCGATVLLTRETSDVNMSNQERAFFAINNNPDVFLRIHADSANDSETSGVRVYVPDSGDYTSTNVTNGDILGQLVAEAEGMEFTSTRSTYLYTGLNYANSIRSYQISLGFLSNSDDEGILLNPDNEVEVAAAIASFCGEIM